MLEPFQYRVRKKKQPVNVRKTPTTATEPEQLVGSVHGYNASEIEERFAKALDKREITYWFRVAINAERGMPGWKELDFLVEHFGIWPVEVEDVTYVHRGTSAEDALKDAITMESLKDYNPHPVIHVTNFELETQELADATVRRLFG